jgi:uncharacterized LabA/DUF88 family protein
MVDNTHRRKIYAFVDSQNLNLGVAQDIYRKGKKIYSGWKLDFTKFHRYLEDKFRVEKAYLFIGHVAGNEKLYTKLQEDGYILVFKPTLEVKRCGKRITKGNVDAELVLHTMMYLNEYDSAVVVSGDGDFRCLVEYLDGINKLEKIVIPNKASYSSLLREFSSHFGFVSTNRKKLEFKNTKIKKASINS